jgi:hypothetical protein
MTPADLARRYAKKCPQCGAHPSKVSKCRCCAGAGVVIELSGAAAMLTEERAKFLDGLFLLREANKAVGEAIQEGTDYPAGLQGPL